MSAALQADIAWQFGKSPASMQEVARFEDAGDCAPRIMSHACALHNTRAKQRAYVMLATIGTPPPLGALHLIVGS